MASLDADAAGARARQAPIERAVLTCGALTGSAVRELTRVATGETQASWLAGAERMVVNQLECLVAGHSPMISRRIRRPPI